MYFCVSSSLWSNDTDADADADSDADADDDEDDGDDDAVAPGVTYFGAYHRLSDGNFYQYCVFLHRKITR